MPSRINAVTTSAESCLYKLQKESSTVILCFGDSNTYGYDPCMPWGRYGDDYRWPVLLGRRMGEGVIECGLNGREISCGERAVDSALALFHSCAPFDRMIIMLGSNDMLTMRYVSAKERPSRIAERMDVFLEGIKDEFPDIDILLICPTDITDDGCRISLSDEYRKLSKKHGTGFADANLWDLPLAYDDIHFTEKANEIFAGKVYELLV